MVKSPAKTKKKTKKTKKKSTAMSYHFVARCALLLGLLSLPAQASDIANVNDAEMSFETCGAGQKTVVLLHDGIVNATVFDAVWPALCKQYRMVRYDRRGYGKTPAATAAYSPVEDLAALLKHLGIARASFVGASAAGGIVIDFALQFPEAVDKLVLVGPAVSGFPISEQFITDVKPLAEAMVTGETDTAIALILSSHITAKENTAARAKLRAILNANPQDVRARRFQRNAKDSMSRVGELRAPTLIMIGDGDHAQNMAQAEALKSAVPGLRLERVPHAGHLPYLEQPKIFLRVVNAFLK